jgi:hypothetical protein
VNLHVKAVQVCLLFVLLFLPFSEFLGSWKGGKKRQKSSAQTEDTGSMQREKYSSVNF